MRNRTFYFTLLLVSLAFGLNGCGLDNNDNTGTPPPNNPPVANPPPVEPPSDEDPSSETPPAEEPPLEEPPAEQPPVEEPPAEEPVPEEPEPVGALTLDPEIAAKGVAPNGNIVLISDRPLDATSVEASLNLRDAKSTETIPANVDYDAQTQAITVTPAKIFNEEKQYAVHLDGVRDMEGNAVGISGQSVVSVKRRIYSRSITYNEAGDISGVSIFMPVPGTDEARTVSYIGPGVDGDWLNKTDDNETSDRYTVTQYPAAGIEIEKVFINTDNLERAYFTRKDMNGRTIEKMHSTDAGDDGDLFTADDNFVSAGFWNYNDAGQLTHYFYAGGSQQNSTLNPGEDEKWLTGDDNIGS